MVLHFKCPGHKAQGLRKYVRQNKSSSELVTLRSMLKRHPALRLRLATGVLELSMECQ